MSLAGGLFVIGGVFSREYFERAINKNDLQKIQSEQQRIL